MVRMNDPLATRVPCVFCGKRLHPKQKLTHGCWKGGDVREDPYYTEIEQSYVQQAMFEEEQTSEE